MFVDMLWLFFLYAAFSALVKLVVCINMDTTNDDHHHDNNNGNDKGGGGSNKDNDNDRDVDDEYSNWDLLLEKNC